MWESHFSKTPPADEVVPVLLAQIWCLIAQFAGMQEAKPWHVAPWLEPEKKEMTPEEKKKKQLERASQLRQMLK